ncbi:MAG: FAD-dependent oxidoreductase, partial [Alphaproteobacteria bacterium]|nr:FAD-dependent oxidoreductase [Alphaproteobacteria bacterium]
MNEAPEFRPGPDRPLPEATEVVVIGGGVVGVTAALTLAEWGVPAVLCEKGRIAGEQSSRNWGWIRVQGRDVREIPLMLESQALWRRFGERSNVDFGLR